MVIGTLAKTHFGDMIGQFGTIYTITVKYAFNLRVGFSWMMPIRGAKFDGVRYAT